MSHDLFASGSLLIDPFKIKMNKNAMLGSNWKWATFQNLLSEN